MNKTELIKNLDEAGYRESALLLQNWNEKDDSAIKMEEELEKSGYKGYDNVVNIRRKANNLEGENDTGIHTMNRVKSWSQPSKDKMIQDKIKEHKKQSNESVKLWTKELGWHKKDKKGNITQIKEEDKETA